VDSVLFNENYVKNMINKKKLKDGFNFEDLRNAVHDDKKLEKQPDFNEMKTVLLTVLEEQQPIVKQTFDQEKEKIVFQIIK